MDSDIISDGSYLMLNYKLRFFQYTLFLFDQSACTLLFKSIYLYLSIPISIYLLEIEDELEDVDRNCIDSPISDGTIEEDFEQALAK